MRDSDEGGAGKLDDEVMNEKERNGVRATTNSAEYFIAARRERTGATEKKKKSQLTGG